MDYHHAKSAKTHRAEPLSNECKKAIAHGAQRDAVAKLQTKNTSQIKALRSRHESHFAEWHYELRRGFSLLFYGFGSSKLLLDEFAASCFTDGAVLAVNGWARHLSIRALLQKVINVLRAAASDAQHRATGDARALLQTAVQSTSRQRLYLLIHGIDSPALRSGEAQSMLAELAAAPTVHLIASASHVNAPLLWDKKTASRFCWLFHGLNTFVTGQGAAAQYPPLLTASRAAGEKKGSSVALHTLVARARQIWRLLAEHQLGTEEPGMTSRALFDACRAQFLVANELALKSHLGEFRDHELVEVKKSAEGLELYHIPMSDTTIQEILDGLDGRTEDSTE